MTTTLDNTHGSTTANTFVTLSEAADLVSAFNYVPGLGIDTSGWTALGSGADEAKKVALVEAARLMRDLPYCGVPSTTTQALPYPMTFPFKTVDSAAVLSTLQRAQVAQACALLLPRPASASQIDEGIVSASIGDRSTEYSTSRMRSRMISPSVELILRSGGLYRSGVSSIYTPRG